LLIYTETQIGIGFYSIINGLYNSKNNKKTYERKHNIDKANKYNLSASTTMKKNGEQVVFITATESGMILQKEVIVYTDKGMAFFSIVVDINNTNSTISAIE
jgi:hypothetical protein